MALPPPVSLCGNCDSSFTHSDLLSRTVLSEELLIILQTNSVYNPTDVRAIISAAPAELARYDEELDRLSGIWERVYSARGALQHFYDQCIAVDQAPVRRLPPEVLAQIFDLCLEENRWNTAPIVAPEWEERTREEIRRVAGGNLIPISQVCTRWRQVALGTPTLWSTVQLDLHCWELPLQSPRSDYWFRQMLSFLEVALQRGQQTPLTVAVRGGDECHIDVLQSLVLHAHRWWNAEFAVGGGMFTHFPSVGDNLPLLETLSLHTEDPDLDAFSQVAEYFAEAPRLRTLHLQGPLAAADYLPLRHLDNFTQLGVRIEDLPLLLCQISQLEDPYSIHLVINSDASNANAALPPSLPQTVSAVRQLGVYFPPTSSNVAIVALLNALTMPNLQRLALLGMERFLPNARVYWPQVEAHALFRRCASGANLQALHLRDVVITETELLECLEMLPALRELFISDHAEIETDAAGAPVHHHLITDSLLYRLSPSAKPTCLVPHLEVLDIRTLGIFSDEKIGVLLVERDNLVDSFECTLLWIPGHGRELHPEVAGVLQKEMDGGKLYFFCEEFDWEDEEL